jgi:purine-cytosine permease-like protein
MSPTETTGAPLPVSYQDDPRVVEEAATDDYSLHLVPLSWRMSRGSLMMAYWAFASGLFYLVIAGTVALAVGTANALIGIALSVVSYGVLNYVIARYTAYSGLTAAMFSRSIFGSSGAVIATLLFAATALYYFIFEGSVIAVAFQEYIGGDIKLWYLVVVLYSMPLVLRGARVFLDRFNGALLPFYVIGLGGAVVWAIAEFGYDGAWLSFEPESTAGISGPGWWFAFTAYMGVWLFMVVTMDFARLGRREDARFNGLVTFGPGFYLFTFFVNGVAGIFLAHTIPTSGGLSETSAVLGIVSLMGLAGVAFIWISQTRINTGNLYNAANNLERFVGDAFSAKLPRWVWVIVCGAASYAVMLTDVFSFILDALRYQGVLVTAWVAIILTQIAYTHRRRILPERVEFRPGRVPAVNPGGVAAWLLSSALGIYLIEAGGSFGATWGPPITAVVAGGAYALALTHAHDRWFVRARPGDPRAEVDDPWSARVRCAQCDRSYVALEMDRNPAAGHSPICAACATDRGFLRAARSESAAAPVASEAPEALEVAGR